MYRLYQMIVQTEEQLNLGWYHKLNIHVHNFKVRNHMKIKCALSKIAFGSFAITATLFSSGCAYQTPQQPMAMYHLDHFQIDCRIKEQQILFLQSQRTTRDDNLVANIQNAITPWTAITTPNSYYERQQIVTQRTNWTINQLLMSIDKQCH